MVGACGMHSISANYVSRRAIKMASARQSKKITHKFFSAKTSFADQWETVAEAEVEAESIS